MSQNESTVFNTAIKLLCSYMGSVLQFIWGVSGSLRYLVYNIEDYIL